MGRFGYLMLFLAAFAFIAAGCRRGPMKGARIESEFNKITTGMDISEVMPILNRTGAQFEHAIDLNGENTFTWYAPEGLLRAVIVFENRKVVSAEWLGAPPKKEPPPPPAEFGPPPGWKEKGK